MTHRTEAWKQELSDKQIADIEYIAGSAMQMLGYELTPGAARTSSRSRRYFSQAFDGIKQLVWQLPKRHLVRRIRGIGKLPTNSPDQSQSTTKQNMNVVVAAGSGLIVLLAVLFVVSSYVISIS